jgi:hypothetical protein
MSEVKLRLSIRDLYRGDGGPLNDYNQGWNDGTDAAAEVFSAEIDALRAEVEALRVDAERYRAKREIDMRRIQTTPTYEGSSESDKAMMLKAGQISYDAAIDAARKESA